MGLYGEEVLRLDQDTPKLHLVGQLLRPLNDGRSFSNDCAFCRKRSAAINLGLVLRTFLQSLRNEPPSGPSRSGPSGSSGFFEGCGFGAKDCYDCHMSDAARKLASEALQLSEDERAELAVVLIRSLDGDPEADVEAVWGQEIERRARDALTGNSHTERWNAVRERARARVHQ